MITKAKLADLGERAGWTLLQAGFGEAVVTAFDFPQIYAVPIAGALAALKGLLAQKFGNGTAATLPRSVEAAPGGRHQAP